jgi:hypothetical protein
VVNRTGILFPYKRGNKTFSGSVDIYAQVANCEQQQFLRARNECTVQWGLNEAINCTCASHITPPWVRTCRYSHNNCISRCCFCCSSLIFCVSLAYLLGVYTFSGKAEAREREREREREKAVQEWKNKLYINGPLWSSGQSFWLQIRRPGFDSRHYRKKVVGLERGPLSLVSTTEELLDRKVAAPV